MFCDRRGWYVPTGGISKREGLGILTGFPLAVWQSKLSPAGRKAMSQNLMAQNAFLIRWPPPVSKAKTYRRPSPSSNMLGPLALRPAGDSKIANDVSARETLIKYPTPPSLLANNRRSRDGCPQRGFSCSPCPPLTSDTGRALGFTRPRDVRLGGSASSSVPILLPKPRALIDNG